MEFYQVLKKRHSIRKFSNSQVESDTLNRIINSAKTAPSSRNKKPVSLFTVTDKNELELLSLAKQSGSAFIKDAGTAIIVAGDPEKSDVWIEDCSIVMTYLHLAATEENLASCWVQCRNRTTKDGIPSGDYIKANFKIPQKLQVLAVLALGVK